MGFLEDKDDWKDKISANKQLKFNFQIFPEELKHIIGFLDVKDDWKDQISANTQLKANFQMCLEELKHRMGVLEDKDDWKDQISAKKELKVFKGKKLNVILGKPSFKKRRNFVNKKKPMHSFVAKITT